MDWNKRKTLPPKTMLSPKMPKSLPIKILTSLMTLMPTSLVTLVILEILMAQKIEVLTRP